MRINYIYGKIRYNKYTGNWYPMNYGYVIEEIENNYHIHKISRFEFIYRNKENEMSIRIGKRRREIFDKLYRAGNIIFWIKTIEKERAAGYFNKYRDKIFNLNFNLGKIDSFLKRAENIK